MCVRVSFDGFEFDTDEFTLVQSGRVIAIEPQIFDVVALLILHRDRVVPKKELLDEVWGDRFVSESALTSRIKAVRQALGDDGSSQRFVQTIRGRIYRFIASVTELSDQAENEIQNARTAISPPSGVVTFLFTDVENSSELGAADRDAMSASLQVHDRILPSGFGALGGFAFATAADSFAGAFSRASDAAESAIAVQEALGLAEWPGPVLRVRMGLHLGETEERGDDYFGPVVKLTARLESAGHGSPLAIELAAARSNVLSPTELFDGPGSRFEMLRGGRRHRSKRALDETLDWSYRLLDDEEQTLLRAMPRSSTRGTEVATGRINGCRSVACSEFSSNSARSIRPQCCTERLQRPARRRPCRSPGSMPNASRRASQMCGRNSVHRSSPMRSDGVLSCATEKLSASSSNRLQS